MLSSSFIYPVFTLNLKDKYGLSLEKSSILFIFPYLKLLINSSKVLLRIGEIFFISPF
jgi:hypothetical protein